MNRRLETFKDTGESAVRRQIVWLTVQQPRLVGCVCVSITPSSIKSFLEWFARQTVASLACATVPLQLNRWLRYKPLHLTTTRSLPAKLVKQWFGVLYRRQIRRGAVQWADSPGRLSFAFFFLYVGEITQQPPRHVSALVRATNSFPI